MSETLPTGEQVHWTSAPPKAQTKPTYELIRSGKKHGLELDLLCLSDELLGTEAHFGGRTIPCMKRSATLTEPEQPCSFCAANQATRWVGYFAAWWFKCKRQVVTEITPGVVPIFEEYAKLHGGLRGARVKLSRKGKRINSPLTAYLTPYDDMSRAPLEFDLKSTLYRIWQIKPPMTSAEIQQQALARHEQGIPAETAPIMQPGCERHRNNGAHIEDAKKTLALSFEMPDDTA